MLADVIRRREQVLANVFNNAIQLTSSGGLD
jgi:hypothetical protein